MPAALPTADVFRRVVVEVKAPSCKPPAVSRQPLDLSRTRPRGVPVGSSRALARAPVSSLHSKVIVVADQESCLATRIRQAGRWRTT
jgi:hypothetical protein